MFAVLKNISSKEAIFYVITENTTKALILNNEMLDI
jgi:hypothetical protein